MHTIEFTDIRIRAALPLHPYLAKHPRLFLRLVVDGNVCEETPGINGDLATGIWEFNSKLYARVHAVKQSLTIAVVAGVKGPGIQGVSVTLKVAELLARVTSRPNGYQEFDIFDSSAPIQLKLVMTCSIAFPPIVHRSSQAVDDGVHTVNKRGKNTQPYFGPNTLELPSRGDLEASYAKVIRMPDQDDGKARQLCRLGCKFHALYFQERAIADLQRGVSIHEEAMQLTGPLHPQLAEHTYRFAVALLDRFKEGGDPADIERAISLSQTSVDCTHDRDVDKPARLSNLGKALRLRFERMGDPADMENSISCQQEAVYLTPDGSPDKSSWLSNLGTALGSRFERLGNLADIDAAISSLQQSVELTPDGHLDKPSRLNNLGNKLQSRFLLLGSRTDIDAAISNLQLAAELMPDGHHNKPRLLLNLRNAVGCRSKGPGSLADADAVISSLRYAVEITPYGHPEMPIRLNHLGNELRSRFERIGNLADIDAAISNLQQAVELTPGGHPDEPSRFNSLGVALQLRFERVDSLRDLGDAISDLRKAVELAPDGLISTPSMLCNLGTALESRFNRLGTLKDIDEAISSHQKAVDLTSDGYHDRSRLFNNLGNALQSRFERLDTLTDLDKAISNQQHAVELTSDGDPDKPSWLSNLGIALEFRFKRLDNLVDLDDAISNHRKAVELAPDGHHKIPILFNNLSLAVQSRFRRLGSLADLDDAISNNRKAVKLTPDADPNKRHMLCNLGDAIQSRFEQLGSLADVDDAISIAQKAVALTPDGHPDEAIPLKTLGSALILRFRRLGSLTDLAGGILNHRKAVELTPDGHPGKLARLGNLGNAIKLRFEYLGTDLADIDEAISSLKEVIEIIPDRHPNEPILFNNLGLALRSRFERFGSSTDMDDAISNHRKAVELTPEGHPNKPSYLYNLGFMLVTRFDRLSILSDLEDGLSRLSAAANSTSGSAIVRFSAAHLWAQTAKKYYRSPLDAYRCAINLLPRIAWLGLSMSDQHTHLAEFGSIVRDAVAAAIRFEEYETAVVWAEQGRSIVWQNLLGLRSPVDNLRIAHRALATRLQSISQQLEGSGSHDALREEVVSVEDVSSKYSKLAVEWDNIVEEVRNIPGFEDFLKAKSFRQLSPATHEGPVVILNVNDAHCDALVLVADGSNDKQVSVANIQLKRFSDETSKDLFQSLTGLLTGAGVRVRDPRLLKPRSHVNGEAKFKDILRVLWQDIVKPVLEGLAFQTKSKRPPRIWWCVIGLLTFLPIHAAGLYDTPEVGERISDYVISSYTPTLSAILELSDPVVREDFQVLTVAQASASGAQPIPETEDEVRIVQRLTDGVHRVNLMRENATVERVREEMIESNWIHLACHGQQNPDDPMESGFLLHDKILKLSEIVKMSLPKADFAFLSACQTAMGDEKVAEESVHLAAGMLLSGCRGVIATTWSIRDEDGPKIAEDVYSRIFKDGKPNRKEAAYALHEAVKRLRESGAECTSWVPFIHIGR